MKINRNQSRRRLAKLLLVIFGILIGSLIAEIALRVAGFSYPEFYQPDNSRGIALRPGMEGWYRKEGNAFVKINSDGLRDREHTKQKPERTLRIAVIGDSYPEAFQVDAEQAFWSVMETRMQTCADLSGREVEVINFGVSGYGTAQELITLREHVWQYSPDIVILTITTNNDITDNRRALKKTDQVPYFVYREGKLVLDDSFKNTRAFRFQQTSLASAGRWIRDHSRLAQVIIQAHRAIKIFTASWRSRLKGSNVPAQSDSGDKGNIVARSAELGTDNVVYVETDDPVWRDAWSVTEGLIVEMRNEVNSHGAKFLTVTLSNGIQVNPDAGVRQDFMKRFSVNDLFYPDHRIELLCRREGINCLILAPELQAYAEQNHVYLHGVAGNIGEGHWNPTGHRVAGELLAEKLCQQGLLK
jgi:lysophospholipase L1-like esterase